VSLMNPKMLAGSTGLEPCVARVSKLLMARDFWSKGLISRDLRSSSRCSRVLRRPAQSPSVLETSFWRRFSAHIETKRDLRHNLRGSARVIQAKMDGELLGD
jgi:hypothetical protein